MNQAKFIFTHFLKITNNINIMISGHSVQLPYTDPKEGMSDDKGNG